jgi:Holliday junction DNA helicase RuvA
MFNSISGTVTAKLPRQLFLENNGIEWDICVPDSNLELLPAPGQSAKVYTFLQHTEQLMCLYGFANSEERSLFLELIKVDGVGPKGAVKIMSSATSRQLKDILENGETALLEKIPGVGKKTAAKMMLALKGKLTLNDEVNTVRLPKNSLFSDVIDSLVNMGFDKKNVELKISELSSRLENELNDKTQKEKEEIIFRRAIVELS